MVFVRTRIFGIREFGILCCLSRKGFPNFRTKMVLLVFILQHKISKVSYERKMFGRKFFNGMKISFVRAKIIFLFV